MVLPWWLICEGGATLVVIFWCPKQIDGCEVSLATARVCRFWHGDAALG
jgi:hypothetical protein